MSILKIPIPDSVGRRPPAFWDPMIGLDADEVLVDFINTFEAYARTALQQAGITSRVALTESATYYFGRDPHSGITVEEEGRLIREFALSKDGYRTLPFKDGAVETVAALRRFGIRPMILTAVPGAGDTSGENHQPFPWAQAQRGREEQFRAAGIILNRDEWKACSRHEKASWMLNHIYRIPVLVDDQPSTLVSAAADFGLIAIGIRTTASRYNQGEYPGVVWFNSLAEALPAIKQVYQALAERGLLSDQLHLEAEREGAAHETK